TGVHHGCAPCPLRPERAAATHAPSPTSTARAPAQNTIPPTPPHLLPADRASAACGSPGLTGYAGGTELGEPRQDPDHPHPHAGQVAYGRSSCGSHEYRRGPPPPPGSPPPSTP